MVQSTCSRPRLSPLNCKPILLGFDGADMSSDAGLTLLREIERKAGLAQRLAGCIWDPRDPAKVQHSLCDIIRFRIMITVHDSVMWIPLWCVWGRLLSMRIGLGRADGVSTAGRRGLFGTMTSRVFHEFSVRCPFCP